MTAGTNSETTKSPDRRDNEGGMMRPEKSASYDLQARLPVRPPTNGLERYTTRRVVFARPFTLGKAPEVYLAGDYEVETKEQSLDAGGHTAHVRTSTVLMIPTTSGFYCREVRGSALDEAIARDAKEGELREASENPDRGHSEGSLSDALS